MKSPDFGPSRHIEIAYENGIRRILKSALPPKRPEQDYAEWIAELANLSLRQDVWTMADDLAKRMVTWSNVSNAKAWKEAAARSQKSRMLYRLLQLELEGPVGERYWSIIRRNAELIRSIPKDIAIHLNAHLAKAQQQGMRAESVTRLMRAEFPRLASWKINLIARTEVAKAASALTEAKARDVGIAWAAWDTSHDQRVRPSHRFMDGVLVNWDDPPSPEALIGQKSSLGKYLPGNAPNCFPGDTVVSSPSGIKKLWRAPYSGNIIDIEVEGGVRFSATPNHPILTENGWVAARHLDVGNYLVHLRPSRDSVIQPDVGDGVSTFHDVFEAASLRGKHSRALSLNFHGDVIHDDIDEITIANDLHFNRETDFSEGVGNFHLARPNSWISHAISCVSDQIACTFLTSRFDEMEPFLGAAFTHSDVHGIRSISRSDSGDMKVTSHGIATYPEMERDSFFAPEFFEVKPLQHVTFNNMPETSLGEFNPQARFIQSTGETASRTGYALGITGDRFARSNALVRITKKTIRIYSGHVYTLESGCGWYGVTSAQIIAQNCRCGSLPLLSLDDVKFPARVYSRGRIVRMTRVQFAALTGIPARVAA